MDDTSDIDALRADIFQPQSREEYEKNHALLINETGRDRVTIFTISTTESLELLKLRKNIQN